MHLLRVNLPPAPVAHPSLPYQKDPTNKIKVEFLRALIAKCKTRAEVLYYTGVKGAKLDQELSSFCAEAIGCA
jgi:hypothetical protein